MIQALLANYTVESGVCRGGREQYLQGQRVDLHPSLLLSASPLGTTDLVSKGPSVDALALQVLARGLGGC